MKHSSKARLDTIPRLAMASLAHPLPLRVATRRGIPATWTALGPHLSDADQAVVSAVILKLVHTKGIST